MNGNGFMKFILSSPLHGLMSGNTMLITVLGRKSGRPITLPVNYAGDGDTLWVISRRDRNWWRNVRGGALVKINLRGRALEAYAETVEDEQAVAQDLGGYVRKIPLSARTLGIRQVDGLLDPQDVARAACDWLLIRVQVKE